MLCLDGSVHFVRLQCAMTASGMAAQCIISSYFAKAQLPRSLRNLASTNLTFSVATLSAIRHGLSFHCNLHAVSHSRPNVYRPAAELDRWLALPFRLATGNGQQQRHNA